MPKNLQQASNSIKHQTANNLQPVQSSLSKCLSYTFFHHMFHHVGDSNSFFLPWFFLWKHLFHLLMSWHTWEVTVLKRPRTERRWEETRSSSRTVELSTMQMSLATSVMSTVDIGWHIWCQCDCKIWCFWYVFKRFKKKMILHTCLHMMLTYDVVHSVNMCWDDFS